MVQSLFEFKMAIFRFQLKRNRICNTYRNFCTNSYELIFNLIVPSLCPNDSHYRYCRQYGKHSCSHKTHIDEAKTSRDSNSVKFITNDTIQKVFHPYQSQCEMD